MNQAPTRINQFFAALFGLGLMNQTPSNKSNPYKNKSIFYGIIRSGLVEPTPYVKKVQA